jgi:hypothetical protein
MAGMELPSRAIRDQIASAINIIVQISRFSDGSRKITHVSEVLGMDKDGQIEVKDIFRYKQTNLDENGKVHGEFYATTHIPEFVSELQARGINLNTEIFKIRVKM